MNFEILNEKIAKIDKKMLEASIKELNQFKSTHAEEIYDDELNLKLTGILEITDKEVFAKNIQQLINEDPSLLTKDDSVYVVAELISRINSAKAFYDVDIDDDDLIKVKYYLLQAFEESYKHCSDEDVQILFDELLTYSFCAKPKHKDYCLLDLYDTILIKDFNDIDYNAFKANALKMLIKTIDDREILKYLKDLQKQF